MLRAPSLSSAASVARSSLTTSGGRSSTLEARTDGQGAPPVARVLLSQFAEWPVLGVARGI
jgi:hypothetical protein